MARPEAPIDFTIAERGELAQKLRSLRAAAGITYAQLVKNTGGEFSASHYKRAASGKVVPGTDVVLSYARGCLGKVGWPLRVQLDVLQFDAELAVEKAELNERRSTIRPKPHLVRSLADLSGAMRAAWARAGRPSTRKIAKRADIYVPHSTAYAIVTGRSVPRDLRQYLYFLEACDVTSPDDFTVWIRAWIKAWGITIAMRTARHLDWLDGVGVEIYNRALTAELAEQYRVRDVTLLLDRAIDYTLASIEGTLSGKSTSSMASLALALEWMGEVHDYIRENTSTTYGAIV
ncbi:helix-turn-helix domain-containing protein [Streptomyces cinereoruber]|uniref:helix-turn-helix domain-containing protein n=1 Tax=Streptomyces cinereoruber TaxID=67260 RepID=UPI00363CF4FD